MAPAILVPVPLSPGTLLVPRPVATPRPRLLARAGKGSSEEGTSGPGAHRGRSGCARLPESADPRPGLGRAAGGGGSAEGRWKCPLREMGQRGGGGLWWNRTHPHLPPACWPTCRRMSVRLSTSQFLSLSGTHFAYK